MPVFTAAYRLRLKRIEAQPRWLMDPRERKYAIGAVDEVLLL